MEEVAKGGGEESVRSPFSHFIYRGVGARNPHFNMKLALYIAERRNLYFNEKIHFTLYLIL